MLTFKFRHFGLSHVVYLNLLVNLEAILPFSYP